MSETQTTRIYRVDKFVVPGEARDEFLRQLRRSHAVLQKQPGFVRDLVLEQSAGPGEFNFVTIVEWESQDAIENARDAVGDMHEREGFDPQEMFSRLGITADVATYTRIDS